MKSAILLLMFAASQAFAGPGYIGQKCRPLGPLQATDTVDKIARCYCESAAFMGAAAFDAAGSFGYQPADIRTWVQPADRTVNTLSVWADPKSNFVTLLSSTGTQKRIERYAYYQASDGESVEQMKLFEVEVSANIQSDGSATCNLRSVGYTAADLPGAQ